MSATVLAAALVVFATFFTGCGVDQVEAEQCIKTADLDAGSYVVPCSDCYRVETTRDGTVRVNCEPEPVVAQ